MKHTAILVALLASLVGAGCSGGAKQVPPSSPGDGPDSADSTAPPAYDAVPLIPREILFGNPTYAAAKISPAGTHVAYLAPRDGVLNVWVRPTGQPRAGQEAGDTADRPVTSDRVRGVRWYFWAPSSDKIIYLQDQGGDENFHAYIVPIAGDTAAEPLDLTPIDGVRAEIIAVDSSRPKEILVGINDRVPEVHDVYKIDLSTGKRTLVQKNDIGAIAWIADHTLTVRAAHVPTADGGFKLMHRTTAKAPWRELMTVAAEDFMATGPIGFAGDNKTLYVMSSVGTNTGEIRAIDVTTGKETTLAADPTVDASEVLVHPTTHALQAVSFNRARKEWSVLDPTVQADFDALAALQHGDLSVLGRNDADTLWTVQYEQDKGPAMYYLYDRAGKSGTFLFAHRPELQEVILAEMQPVSYQSRDGLTIHAYLTTPPRIAARSLPAVILPHGGPWARDDWGYDPLVQLLANRGYAVLQPNFRGSLGYGKEFVNIADKQWGGTMQDDLTDGTRWLIEQGIADPARICIMGGSYGGYATLMGLAKEPDLYACGVDIVGVANIITWMSTIPPYWMPILPILHQRVGNPATEADFLRSRSPVFLADRIKAPLLIGQGANDPRVPRAESIQIRDALARAGREVQYIEYADEGHGFARPENRLAFFAEAEKFLAEHIGSRYEEQPETQAAE